MEFTLRRVLTRTSFDEEERRRPALRYWLERPARERIAAVEFLRRQVHGSGARLRRVHPGDLDVLMNPISTMRAGCGSPSKEIIRDICLAIL
jgi:hypothetical protein